MSVDSVTQSDPHLTRAWLRGTLTKAWSEVLVFVDSGTPAKIDRVSVGRGLLPPYRAIRQQQPTQSEIVSEVRRFLSELARNDRFSGVVILSRNGVELFSESYGFADEARRVRITKATPFNLASAGKLFTSTAIAKLVRDGRLRLTDTVSALIPELPVGRRITLGQLLQHSSGLGELGESFDTLAFVTAAEYLPYLADTALAFPPGTDTRYSNRGYVVAGIVAERAAREPFAEYVRRTITGPLGMSRTGFIDPADESSGRAVGLTYYPSIRGGFVPGIRRANTSLVRRGSPAGGSYASAADMQKLAEALRTNVLGDGRSVIYSVESATRFGLMVSPDRMWFGHGGGHPGVSAHVWSAPNLGFSLVVLSNYDAVANHVAAYLMELATSMSVPGVPR
jgi:CubicO group peptidase (beta-lactamase class C family)